MINLQKYNPFFIATLLLGVLLLMAYPFMQYYVDPDAVAYLTISERYANGDFMNAVNGYWSPWSCWLTAILIKVGLAPFVSAVIINGLAGVLILFVTYSFFEKFNLHKDMQGNLLVVLAIFLCYATYKQLFADLWQCGFLLYSLRIMSSDRFRRKPLLWVLTGVFGALAYFSKAYAFPFFILNVLLCTWYATKAYRKKNRMLWAKISIVSIGTMFLLSSPWVFILQHKYGMLTTGTAGRLNLSWYLVGHPVYADAIKHLLPPALSDSVYYWEDPYLVNGATPMFWSSFSLFGKQILKIGYDLLLLPLTMCELSVLFVFIWLSTVGMVLSRKLRHIFCTNKIVVPGISFLLFPLGFLLINFESRYIWYMLPLSMLFGGLMLQRILPMLERHFLIRTVLTVLFVCSYLIYPLYDARNLVNVGKHDKEVATAIQDMGLQGSFTSNAVMSNGYTPSAARIAYFSGLQYYNMPFADVPYTELLQEMDRYGIEYYLYFYDTELEAESFNPCDENGDKWQQIEHKNLSGVRIYRRNRR